MVEQVLYRLFIPSEQVNGEPVKDHPIEVKKVIEEIQGVYPLVHKVDHKAYLEDAYDYTTSVLEVVEDYQMDEYFAALAKSISKRLNVKAEVFTWDIGRII